MLLALALIVVSIAAERSVITGGTLGGGALVPAFEGSSSLWAQFAQAYHPVGVGSGSAGPPYIGLVALLSTILLGKAWLGIDVLLLGCVPLAGVGAYLALRRVTASVAVRIWAAAAYAFLPVAFGAIAAWLGTAVAFATIPLIGMFAGRMLSGTGKQARRAAWATGLAVTIGTAFVPLLWPLTVAGALIALALRWRACRSLLTDVAIAVLTPPVLLLPWLLQLLKHPAQLLLEAGLPQPGLTAARLPARSLLLLSPGGPGLPPYWVSAALLLAGLVALIASRRRALVTAGWIVALLGFAAAVLATRTTVTSPGGQAVTAWPGTALAVAAAGLLLAAAAAADGLGGWLSRGRAGGARGARGARVVPVILIAAVAASGPLLAVAYWLMNGVTGPLRPQAGPVVLALASGSSATGQQSRTLVLAPGADGTVSFLLLRGDSPEFSEPDLIPDPAAQTALTKAVSALVAPGGGEAVQQSRELAAFDIGSVLLRLPASAGLIGALNGVNGLTEISRTHSFDLWRLSQPASRVSVAESSGAVVPVASGVTGVAGARAPAAGGTLLLSEPAGGWSASLNGHPLTPVSSPAGRWAQAFRLPPGGGTLSVSRDSLWRNLLTTLEIVLFLVVAALALPGIRSRAELEAAAPAAPGRADAADAAPAAEADLETDGAAAPSGVREAAMATAGNRDGNARSGRRSASPARAASGGRGRRGTRLSRRPVKRGDAAGAGAGGAGAGGAGASGAGAGGGGAARGHRGARAAGPASAAGPGSAGESTAAWPAGQRVNRFVSGPPAGANPGAHPGAPPGDETAAFGPGETGEQRGRRGHRGDRADAPAAYQGEQAGPYDSRHSGGYDRPGRVAQDDSRYPGGERPAYDGPADDSSGYGQRQYPGDPGYPGDSPYGRGARGGRGPDPLDYRQPRPADPDDRQRGGAGWQGDDRTSAWPAEPPRSPGAWPAGSGQQGAWPAPGHREQGQPQHDPRDPAWPGQPPDRDWRPQDRDWPQDRDPRPDRPGDRPRGEPRWHVPGQQPWPDQDEDLGDQPAGEVHHGFEPRESRSQGWGIPAHDEEGEDW